MNRMHKKIIKLIGLSTVGIYLSGCSTILLSSWSDQGSVENKSNLIFEDHIISYGIPKVAIKDYENAIALAGTKQSYLVKPVKSENVSDQILRRIYQTVDLKHLIFFGEESINDPSSVIDRQSQSESLNLLSFNDYIPNKPLQQSLTFLFVKPASELKDNEKVTLESLNFRCQYQFTGLGTEGEKLLVCKQKIPIEFTITQKAKNTDQLTDTFRKAIDLKIYSTTQVSRMTARKVVAVPLYPLAVAFDIVTSPIQGAVGYWLSKNLKIGF